MAADLRVVIPTAGRPDLLGRTLTSLAECQQPDIYRETIVVENGPALGAKEVVAASDSNLNVRYIHVERANKSHALNRALEDLSDDCLIVFADDDVRFSKNVLTEYGKAARQVGDRQFYGGSTDIDYDESPRSWLVRWLPVDSRPFGLEEYENGSRYLVFLGFNWAAFAGDIRKAGGFDIRFGPGGTSGAMGQESDMQQRLLGIGAEPRFLPDATVWHYVPRQRCTPSYVAHRHYRIGILDAVRGQNRPTNRWGIPFWHWRRVASAGWRYVASRLHPDVATRFDAKRALYYELGQARGAWDLAHNPRAETSN